MGRFFNGTYYIAPQSAVSINDNALAGPTLTGSGDLCIIGSSNGGQPLTPLAFTTPQDAINTLGGGDGLRAALRAFAPAPNFPGAPRIIFIRINAATRSTFTLLDASGNPSVVLTSTDYGSANNLVQAQVNAGSSSGRLVSVRVGGTTISSDNVTRQAMTVKYAGTNTVTYGVGPVSSSSVVTTVGGVVSASGTAASIVVGSSNGFVVGNQILVGRQGTAAAEVVTITAIVDGTHLSGVFSKAHASGDPIALYTGQVGLAIASTTGGTTDVPAEDAILPFDTYKTVQALADNINARIGFYTATVLTPSPNTDLTLGGIDLVTGGTSLPTGATGVTLTMDLYATLLAFNRGNQPWLTATAAAGASLPPRIEAAGTWHYLAGATDGTNPPLVADWQNGFTAASTIDCSVICVATGNATIHSMLQTHVDVESNGAERHERIAIVGGVAGETIAAVTTRANNIRDPRLGIVYPGILDVDATNAAAGVITIEPWLVAAQMGGMFCGSEIQASLTNQYIRSQGLERQISPSDRDNLLVAGVIPILSIPNKGYRIVQSRSTWVADDNYRRKELSVMRAADFLAKTVRNANDALIGQVVGPQLLLRVGAVTETTLLDLWHNGVIVGDTRQPAYRNIQVSANGDMINVSFEVQIAIPANYIFITASLQPYVGNISI